MALRRKLRAFSGLSRVGAPTPMQPTSRTDVWLHRASLFSQLGLFVVTLGTIYFTVIPLYQKALLDERIAEKEIQLSELEAALNSSYRKLRESVVRDYVRYASAECTGLLLTADSLEKYFDEDLGKPNFAKAVLAIEPSECLLRALDTDRAPRELTTADLVFFRAEIARIGAELDVPRQAAIRRVEDAKEAIRANPDAFTESIGKPGTVAELMMIDRPPEFREAFLNWIALETEQYDAADQYTTELKDALHKLRSLEWPKGS